MLGLVQIAGTGTCKRAGFIQQFPRKQGALIRISQHPRLQRCAKCLPHDQHLPVSCDPVAKIVPAIDHGHIGERDGAESTAVCHSRRLASIRGSQCPSLRFDEIIEGDRSGAQHIPFTDLHKTGKSVVAPCCISGPIHARTC